MATLGHPGVVKYLQEAAASERGWRMEYRRHNPKTLPNRPCGVGKARMRHEIPAALIEFDEGGRTIWVQSRKGATILRIQTKGKIVVDNCCENIVAHSDMQVDDDIYVCIPRRKLK
jgi:hypothetical protein